MALEGAKAHSVKEERIEGVEYNRQIEYIISSIYDDKWDIQDYGRTLMAKEGNRDIINLPADKSAESNLLSLMISEPSEIGKVAQRVAKDDFIYPAHRTIFNTILALYTRPSMGDQIQIDSSTIWDELKHMGKHTDNETDAEDTDVSWSYLQHIAGLAPSITNITNEQGEADEKIQRINQRIRQLDTPQADARVVRLGDSLVQDAHTLHAVSPGGRRFRQITTGQQHVMGLAFAQKAPVAAAVVSTTTAPGEVHLLDLAGRQAGM